MLILSVGKAVACDVCGCAATGSYLGILPQYQQNFAGLSYKYQEFNSLHPEVFGSSTPMEAKDYFQSLTAWGRYYPTERIQLFAFVPYHFNSVKEAGVRTPISGIGDVQLLANYMIWNNADSGSRMLKHNLLIGGGIKLPTGSNHHTNSEGLILSNMQPGTGSWDFLFNLNYTLRYGKWGINTDAMYRLPTVNPRGYKYGDRVSNSYSLFFWDKTGSVNWLPQAGVRYEWSAQDWEHYDYQLKNPYSGGYQLYTHVGIGAYYGPIALQALVSVPVKENYAGGLVTSKNRYETQIQFLF